MKTKYSITKMLGSSTNTNSEDGAFEAFSRNLEAKSVIRNSDKCVLKARVHTLCGTLRTGVKFVGNIKIYECSDNLVKITQLVEVSSDAIARFKKINTNRQFETAYIPC